MIFKKTLTGFSLAVLVSLGGVTAASAQGVDFLWGGGSEWGGGRQTVAFSKQFETGHVVVSFGDRRLYLVTAPGKATSYPIAVPREQSRWQGTTFVSDKRINPAWTPTPTMIAENPRLPRWVPGGHPMNPLGVRALYLGSSTYRIHGTDAPWTIGQAVSKGCVRMFNQDVLDLYPRVPVGARVTVTWQRFSGTAIASNDYSDAPATSSQPTSSNQPAATKKPEPKYEYVDPFTALFGDPEPVQPKRKPLPRTTQIKKYTTSAAKPEPAKQDSTSETASVQTTSTQTPAAAPKASGEVQ